MSGFYQSKWEQKYQSEMAELFSDVQPPVEEQRESRDAFSLELIGFAEMTESLCRDAEVLFDMTATQHRLSESFLISTGNLEKLIRRIGSCCLTKAALESKGHELPSLEGLDIRTLYSFGSFNFRKCHASIQDGISKMHRFNMDMMNMECSWFSTLERLRATEERIVLIREGKVDVDSILRRDGFFREHETSTPKENKSGSSAFAKAASLPILRSAFEETVSGAELNVGTSREPKKRVIPGGGTIFKPISPAQIRKEREKARQKREAELREQEDKERSKQVVEEAVEAMMAQRPDRSQPEKKTAWDSFRAEREKSAVEKWNEILERQSPPDERSGTGFSGNDRKKQKKKKR